MNESRDPTLTERVERLENTVAELQRQLASTPAIPASQTRPPAPAPPPESSRQAVSAEVSPAPDPASEPARTAISPDSSPPSPKRPRPTRSLPDGESWLKIFGIGLFLFGIVFLFKYSIEQGWITEQIRVGMGLLLGTILLGIGMRIHGRRRSYSQALLGGAIAAYYITGYAAFQLYGLVSHPLAFGFMILVTVFAFALSVRQDEPLLSILGAVGGLGTPFLLYTGSGSLPGLIGYTCLVLAGASAIYLFRGWRTLLWVSVIGGWMVLLIGLEQLRVNPADAASSRWALQLGVAFAWLAFWVVPVVREILTGQNPDRWPRPSLDTIANIFSENIKNPVNRHVHLLSVSTPLITQLLFAEIWDPPKAVWGSFAAGCAVLFALAALGLRNRSGCRSLAYTQVLVSLLLLTIAFCLLLEGDVLFLTLAAEAAVLHLISRRLGDRGTAISGHILFAVVSLVLANRLLSVAVEGTPVFNTPALSNLAVIAVGLAISFALRPGKEQRAYRLAVHAGLLGWSLRELSSLEGGQGYVTIAWGIYAIALLVVGMRRNFAQLRMVAMGTLLLVVAKLFMVDLAQLEAIWRILLFLGFGGVFLILGYYFQSLWKPEADPEDETG